MVNVNDLKNGMTIGFDGNIYQVIEFLHVKPGKGPAFVRSKLKNLRSKAIIEHTFTAGIRVERAMVDRAKMQFLYESGGKYHFMNTETYEQLELDKKTIGDNVVYLKEGLDVEISIFENEILDLSVPEKIEYKVTSTEPAVKGNTTGGAMKNATLENGLEIKVPLFIENDELIIVSTKDKKYDSRA